MLQGKPGNFTEFGDHPEGKFTGIVYCWKYLGKKIDNYGNEKKRAMLRIENCDGEAIMEDGRPYSVGVFHNIAWGQLGVRSGTKYPTMQKLRETILETKFDTEEDWYNYHGKFPGELMGVRVRYKVTWEARADGNGNWTNAEIIERAEDQSIGEQFNETEIVLPTEDDEPSSAPNHSEPDHSRPLPKKAPAKKAPPAKKAESAIVMKRAHFGTVVRILQKAGLIDNASEWEEWIADATEEEMANQFPDMEEMATGAGVELPEAKVHPCSTGDDQLPI